MRTDCVGMGMGLFCTWLIASRLGERRRQSRCRKVGPAVTDNPHPLLSSANFIQLHWTVHCNYSSSLQLIHNSQGTVARDMRLFFGNSHAGRRSCWNARGAFRWNLKIGIPFGFSPLWENAWTIWLFSTVRDCLKHLAFPHCERLLETAWCSLAAGKNRRGEG